METMILFWFQHKQLQWVFSRIWLPIFQKCFKFFLFKYQMAFGILTHQIFTSLIAKKELHWHTKETRDHMRGVKHPEIFKRKNGREI